MTHFTHTGKGLRVMLSGGGTGGHIFPAIAIAQEIRKRLPDADFLFVGARGKMEMEKVPQAGFAIEGLNIAGFDRGNLLNNIGLPFKIVSSFFKVRSIISTFKPSCVIGTGGYASGPALYVAAQKGIPTFIQEQNSLPGKTNIYNAKKAEAVFTAYPGMDAYFGETDTIFFGNPVRSSIVEHLTDTKSAKTALGLHPGRLTVLSVGGSLGSKTLNDAWRTHLPSVEADGLQLIWQTGKTEYEQISQEQDLVALQQRGILVREFLSDMALAYSAADIIVSRAGAIAISELALVKKPVILVPYPFAAEDHQTKNAEALASRGAAIMVRDRDMAHAFWPAVTSLVKDDALRRQMGAEIHFFAKPNAAKDIVSEILNMLTD